MLTDRASIEALPSAREWIEATSEPASELRIPHLTVHPIADEVVPAETAGAYRDQLPSTDARSYVRQAWINRAGHTNLTSAEMVASIVVTNDAISAGGWDHVEIDGILAGRAEILGIDGHDIVPFTPSSLPLR